MNAPEEQLNFDAMYLSEPESDTGVTVSFVEYATPVGKSFSYDDGSWVKAKLDRHPVAKAITLAFPDFGAFAEYRKAAGPKLMQVSGTFETTDHGKPCRHAKSVGEGEVAASKQFLAYRAQPGVVKLDSDVKDASEVRALFPEKPATWSTPESFLAAIEAAIPELANHPALVMDSTSARIHHKGTMRKQGDTGFHTDIPVENATEIPAILERLHYRLVAAGLGWAFVDTGGSIQVRSAVDLALKTVTQPAFCAPLLGPGVEQDRRVFLRLTGQRLKLSDIAWTDQMHADCLANVAALKGPLQPLSNQIKLDRNTKIAKALLKREDVTEKEVRAVYEVLERGDVLPAMTVTFPGDPDEEVTVADLLLDGARFDQCHCLDPLRPDYDGGRAVGKFYWNDGMPMIHSFASGSRALRPVWTIETYPKPESIPEAVRALARVTYKVPAEFDALLKSEAKRLRTTATMLKASFDDKAAEAAKVFGEELAAAGIDPENYGDIPPPAAKETKQMGDYGPDDVLPLSLYHPNRLYHGDKETRPLGHAANVEVLLDAYGIDVQYDVIAKKLVSSCLSDTSDNAQIAFFAKLLGLANMNRFYMDNFETFFTAVMDGRSCNPVTDYLSALVWDGKPRIEAFAREIGDDPTVEIAHRLFFVGACAAADGGERGCAANAEARKTYEYVVTYVGGQGGGKTKGIVGMVPAALRRYVESGLRLDLNDKDSIKKVLSCWIAELGELDGTFRKSDIAAIKAFLSAFRDSIRLPYARAASEYLRRTIAVASVNNPDFLHDKTGNRRFMPVSVTKMPRWSDAEVDQLWAEAWHLYTQGVQWWPTEAEDKLLWAKAEEHTETSGTEDLLARKLNFDAMFLPGAVCGARRYPVAEVFNRIHGLPPNAPVSAANKSMTTDALRKLWRLNVDPNLKVAVHRSNGTAVFKSNVYERTGKNRGFLLPPFNDGQHFGDVKDAVEAFFSEIGGDGAN